ncbi:MAG TPA: dipeptide epimerase, partial [Pirellulaceae bacterium]
LDPHPFAQCALDQAAHDWWGKRHGNRTYELWGLTADKLPASNYTIGLDATDVMIRKLQERPDWPIYKIKLGTDHDLDLVRALRQHTAAKFRVDANCGWTADETLARATTLRDLGVEFIEQPLPADDDAGYQKLVRECPLPIIADESCLRESDVAACQGKFHGINIKLVKCGGMTPARRMIAEARRLGLKVMMGCMTESSVGISAIAQFLPLLDYVDMDGAVLLAEDIATGVQVERGICTFSNVPGHGVSLLRSNPL